MKRRELITFLVCAVAVWPLKGPLIALALASPAFAQTPRDDGASIAAEAKDAATQLQTLSQRRPQRRRPAGFLKASGVRLVGPSVQLEAIGGIAAGSSRRSAVAHGLGHYRERGV